MNTPAPFRWSLSACPAPGLLILFAAIFQSVALFQPLQYTTLDILGPLYGYGILPAAMVSAAIAWLAGFLKGRQQHRLGAVLHGLSALLCITVLYDAALYPKTGLKVGELAHLISTQGWNGSKIVAAASGIGAGPIALTVATTSVFFTLFAISHFGSSRWIVQSPAPRAGFVLLLGCAAFALCRPTILQLAGSSQKARNALAGLSLSFGSAARLPKLVECEFNSLSNLRTSTNSLSPQVSALPNLPNIIIFFGESFRADVITDDICPNLSRMANEGINAHGLAAANATYLSWYSALTGNHPLRWTDVQQKRSTNGSQVLRHLKSIGYRIHVISACDMRFLNLDLTVFGSHYELIDRLVDSRKFGYSPRVDADRTMISEFKKCLSPGMNGHVFLLFFDSSHFPYFWPSRDSTKFTPVCDEFEAKRPTFWSKTGIVGLKNRYWNAAHFIDECFGDAFDALVRMGLKKNSLIAFVGDHGQEFLEKGLIAHGSQIVEEQIRVPMILLPPTRTLGSTIARMGHADLFPSISALLGLDPIREIDGRSRLDNPGNVMTFAARIPDAPNQFCISGELEKFWFSIENSGTGVGGRLRMFRITDSNDNLVHVNQIQAFKKFADECQPELERLFGKLDVRLHPD